MEHRGIYGTQGDWYHTDHGHKYAHWTVHPAGWPVIRSVYDPKDPSMGLVWPNRVLPGLKPGYTVFAGGHYPTLQQVRKWLPEHTDVWDAVEEEHRQLPQVVSAE